MKQIEKQFLTILPSLQRDVPLRVIGYVHKVSLLSGHSSHETKNRKKK